MTVHVKIYKRHYQALVDSGAYRSLLAWDSWQDICKSIHQCPKLYSPPPGVTLATLKGDQISVEGMTRLTIYGKSIEFFVLKGLQHDMLLGDDALRILNAKIDYDKNEIVLNKRPHDNQRMKRFEILNLDCLYTEIDKWAAEFPNVFRDPKTQLPAADTIKVENNIQPLLLIGTLNLKTDNMALGTNTMTFVTKTLNAY